MTEFRRASFAARATSTMDPEGGEQPAVVEGYASVFGSRNSYGEVFVPGAFADSIAAISDQKPLPMGYQHEEVIGRWVEQVEDNVGLKLTGVISDTECGQDVSTLLRDGAITGLSIGFWPEEMMAAEPNETVSFATPYGQFTSTQDRWTFYVTRARLAEASLVMTPSDDDARTFAVRSVQPEKVAVALPGLRSDAEWNDVAWSMCRLMGAPGGVPDLAPAERHAAYERLAAAYERHGKTPPEFAPEPEFKSVPFQHDEPATYRDIYLGKRCADVAAGIGSLDRPLSDETRGRALDARDALNEVLAIGEPEAAPEWDEDSILAALDAAVSVVTS